jgi:hypothetical protein
MHALLLESCGNSQSIASYVSDVAESSCPTCCCPALLLVLFPPAGQLERVVTPPCINLAPTGAPSNKPSVIHEISNTAAAAGSGSSKARQKPGSSKGGRGSGSKGGVGMKSCESFVVSPDSHKPLVAFLGDNGHVGLVSLNGRTSVGSLKMNGSARAAAFSSDGSTLVTAGEAHMQGVQGRASGLSQLFGCLIGEQNLIQGLHASHWHVQGAMGDSALAHCMTARQLSAGPATYRPSCVLSAPQYPPHLICCAAAAILWQLGLVEQVTCSVLITCTHTSTQAWRYSTCEESHPVLHALPTEPVTMSMRTWCTR